MIDRAQPPKSYLLEDLSLVDVKLHQLSNGIQLHLFADDTNPVVKLDLFFLRGKRNEQVPGVATLCGRLITEATLSYASDALQEQLDHYGAHLDVSVDYDETTVSLLCLKEHASLLFPLIKSIITEPLFDEKDFEKIKYQLIQKIKINNGKNNVIASKTLREQLLKGSSYASFATVAGVEAIKLSDVKAYFELNYSFTPQIVLAGQIDEMIHSELEHLFGILKFNESVENPSFQVNPIYETKSVKREGSVQASIRLGTLSIAKSNPDYFKLSIANEILGGYFGSRLMKNIREDKGYTYGIYSSITNYKAVDYQVIGADVQIDHVDDAINECKKELLTMQTTAVSDEELTTVKNYMLGTMASHLDNNFSQADNYKSKVAEGVDYKQYFKQYVEEIRNITSEDILAISKKYFSKEFTIVKVI